MTFDVALMFILSKQSIAIIYLSRLHKYAHSLTKFLFTKESL